MFFFSQDLEHVSRVLTYSSHFLRIVFLLPNRYTFNKLGHMSHGTELFVLEERT